MSSMCTRGVIRKLSTAWQLVLYLCRSLLPTAKTCTLLEKHHRSVFREVDKFSFCKVIYQGSVNACRECANGKLDIPDNGALEDAAKDLLSALYGIKARNGRTNIIFDVQKSFLDSSEPLFLHKCNAVPNTMHIIHLMTLLGASCPYTHVPLPLSIETSGPGLLYYAHCIHPMS